MKDYKRLTTVCASFQSEERAELFMETLIMAEVRRARRAKNET